MDIFTVCLVHSQADLQHSHHSMQLYIICVVCILGIRMINGQRTARAETAFRAPINFSDNRTANREWTRCQTHLLNTSRHYTLPNAKIVGNILELKVIVRLAISTKERSRRILFWSRRSGKRDGIQMHKKHVNIVKWFDDPIHVCRDSCTTTNRVNNVMGTFDIHDNVEW